MPVLVLQRRHSSQLPLDAAPEDPKKWTQISSCTACLSTVQAWLGTKSTTMVLLQAREEAADTHHSRCLQARALHHLPCGALHGGAAACGTEGVPQHAALYL